MNINIIKKAIGGKATETQVTKYLAYLTYLLEAKNKDKTVKNTWMKFKKDEYLARIFLEVQEDGLIFDGENITLQSTGVSYNYQAYKNRMLIKYPESIVDVSLVHVKDKFVFNKESGKVIYTHSISDPFNQSEQTVIGAYCVIKNSRGEFLTTISKQEIDKHRKVARTDYIWAKWFMEMALKTVIKKACKQHFNDIYVNIERIDNENYDLEKDVEFITSDQVDIIVDLIADKGVDEDKLLKHFNLKSIKTMPKEKYGAVKLGLESKGGTK